MAASLFATRRTLATIVSRRCRISVPLLLHTHNYELQEPFANRTAAQTRFSTSRSGYSPLNDPSPNWSNRPPKETILLDGCDYEHWLIVMDFNSDPKPTEQEMIDAYVKTLASVVGSEEEAKKKIYSVCTTTYTGFGALISEELSYKVKGDLFVDGKVIHRPQYRFSERQNTRSRPRPRYDNRRRETMQVRQNSTPPNQQSPSGRGGQNAAQGNSGYPPNA